ncbi:MAG: hypothetical protein ACJAZO_000844 [Myxococcota bacterium]|jgi:hypothetical protein
MTGVAVESCVAGLEAKGVGVTYPSPRSSMIALTPSVTMVTAQMTRTTGVADVVDGRNRR